MEGWAIFPRAEGDLLARVGVAAGSASAVQVTVYLRKELAEKAWGRLPKDARDRSEVVPVSVSTR